MGVLSPAHIMVVCAIALLVLGPKRLPEAGRARGRGLRELKQSINGPGVSEPASRGKLPRPASSQEP